MIMESILEKKWFPWFFILVLTLFSLLVAPGYESFVSDQTMFLPPMLHQLDPSIFSSKDLSHARMLSSDRSLINDLIAFFVSRGVPLLWTLFLLSVIFRALFFATLYSVIVYFTENRIRAEFVLLFFLTPFFIPGTGHTTIESLFTYRTVALSLSFLYLALYLRGWRLLSLIPLIFAFTIHAITALPFFCFHYLHTTWRFWQNRREPEVPAYTIWACVIPIVGILFFLWWKQSGATDSFFLRIDTDWKQLANPRNAPAFFMFWSTRSYLSLMSWMVLTNIPLLYLKEFLHDTQKRISVWMLLCVPLLMLILAAFGEYTAIHGLIKLHLQRSILLISFLAPILVGMFTLWHAEEHRDDMLKNTFLFATIAWFLYKDSFIFLREPMLMFIPPLAILFYGPFLYAIRRRTYTLPALAVATFALTDGIVTYRSFFYGDVLSVIFFHLTLLGGWIVALLYAKNLVSSRTLLCYSIAIALPILLFMPIFYAKSFTIYPKFSYNAPYMQACAWIGTHTAKDSVFVVEPFVKMPLPEEFRLACLRSIFTTYKEGGVVPYDEHREVAFAWKRKYELLYALAKDPGLIEQAKKTYQMDYIISQTPLALPAHYPLVFSNDAYYIYDIRN